MTASTDTMAALALSVADAVRDADHVVAALTLHAAATLCDGLAGTALLHACLSRTEPDREATAFQHWQAAARLLGHAPADGIHTGPGALAASLIIGSGYLRDSGRYHDTLPRAVAWLSARAEGLARHQQRRTNQGLPGTPWAVYDAIKGLAGIGRVLLAAHTSGHSRAEAGLTAALTTLTTMIRTADGRRPGWWLPATEHPPTVAVHPTGAATTGLAHGIAGPLVLLAIAHRTGRTVPGQVDAIRVASSWLLTWHNPVTSWPSHISGDDLDAQPVNVTGAAPNTGRMPGRRDAWCYGAPGIGRALTLAGEALADPGLSRAGHVAINTLAHRDPGQWDTEGPTLCHGTAGVLQAAARNGCDTVARQAATHTTMAHDHQRPFGFPRIEGGTAFDEPGFLTGATGTALALLDYSGLLPTDPPTSWDCLMLLS